ncbi:MAG: hypothetical protein COV45_08800 [Deltaproteobacteria bacterium CG11_big_fil_rev_8_21_14_0_20_47_16]|nr:MAG: hypothetical protein COV45_08800 [Deltaproteobacteria bacterium CG11_big_fil_rev_8_21_14_0_20_47_16]
MIQCKIMNLNWHAIWTNIGMGVGFILPVFNLAQIWRMIKFKSSHDISIVWCIGVWTCIVLMLPSALISEDAVYRTFSITNVAFFSALVGTAVYFRIRNRHS